MGIDRKYGWVTFERGDIGPDEPVFVLRAQDLLAPATIRFYQEQCTGKSPQHHLDGVDQAVVDFERWQEANHTQIPRSAG